MKTSRTYNMQNRAAAAERTRVRILDGIIELAESRLVTEISLADVADAADVSLQTVLRHFGSRDGLLEAARDRAVARVRQEREAPAGDIDAAVKVLVDHYEQRGDNVLMMLAQEQADEVLASVVEAGRRLHREWVATVFDPLLERLGGDREEAIDLLVVVTDVYAWKLLRRDRGLGREQTEARIRRMVTAVLDLGDGTGS